MELFLGVLAWCAGTGLFAVSLQWLSRANPGEKLPFIGHPARTPGGAWALTALAIVLLIMSFFMWSEVVGRNWALVAHVIALLPAVTIIIRHNRGVPG